MFIGKVVKAVRFKRPTNFVSSKADKSGAWYIPKQIQFIVCKFSQ